MDYVGSVVASGRWKNEGPWCLLIDVHRVTWLSWTLLWPSPLIPLPPPSLTYTNATPPIPLTTTCISICISHLPIPPLSQTHHHLSHPTRLTSLSLISTVKSPQYTLTPMLPSMYTLLPPYTLPLSTLPSAPYSTAFWSFTNPLFTSPLDPKSLSHFHSYQSPLHSQTIPIPMTALELHTLFLCNFPCIFTLP